MPAARAALPPRRYGRWIALVALSLLLHATILDLLPHGTLDATDDVVELPLQVTLMPPIRPVEPPQVEAPKAVRTAPMPRHPRPPTSTRRPQKAEPPVFVPESADEIPQVQLTPPPGSVGTTPAIAADPAASPVPPAAVAPSAPQSSPEQQVPIAAPPTPPPVAATPPQSARLFYDVVSLDAKNAAPTHYYGVGTIDWSIADRRYRSDLQASYKALFIKVGILASHSEGSIGPTGLIPDRYTETPFRRASVATNFNRDARQSITFSASQASAPLVGGAQDRLSILFQIGGLLLANPEQGAAGGSIEVPVAGVRGDVDRWLFQSQGSEQLQTGVGPLSTIHLRRTPRPGSNDRTIDVWVARDAGGYPAKVLYTEPNGTTIEMVLDRIGTLTKSDDAEAARP